MVAKEYAKALHEIAEELNIVDIIKNQYKITLDLLEDDDDVQDVYHNWDEPEEE